MELIFATDNGVSFSKNLTPGRCNGLSCVWARASLVYGGARYAGMLDEGHINISQQAYEQQGASEVAALEAAGMEVTNRFELANWTPATASATMANTLGTFFVDVKGAGGHAIGFRNDTANGARVFDFFDPNDGLYRSNDVADFQAGLVILFNDPFFANLRLKMRFFQLAKA